MPIASQAKRWQVRPLCHRDHGMQVDWEKSEKGTKYGTQYEVLEGSFRWSQSTILY